MNIPKHLCLCGARQFYDKVETLDRVDTSGGVCQEFKEKFNVWTCEFCHKNTKIKESAVLSKKGLKSPRKIIVNQYSHVLSKFPVDQDHLRISNFFKILEAQFPYKDPQEIIEDMLLEGVIQVDYTMRKTIRGSFKPTRVRLNPDFRNEILEHLRKCKGIEPLDEKVKTIENILKITDYKVGNNLQSEKISSTLRVQEELLSRGEIPFFDCGFKRCSLKSNNVRYETILKILISILDNVKYEKIIVSSELCSSVNLDGNCLSEYRSDVEQILNSKLVYFGILKNIEPLYIPPSKVPREVNYEIEVFEINLRNFIKNRLSDNYGSMDIITSKLFKEIFGGEGWKQIKKSMINDLKSDEEKKVDPEIKKALDIALSSQPYNQFLFDRFFEAMTFDNLIKTIDHQWDLIFSKHFGILTKDNVSAKLKVIKDDRNIQSHRKSRTPTTFTTLTCILELNQYIQAIND